MKEDIPLTHRIHFVKELWEKYRKGELNYHQIIEELRKNYTESAVQKYLENYDENNRAFRNQKHRKIGKKIARHPLQTIYVEKDNTITDEQLYRKFLLPLAECKPSNIFKPKYTERFTGILGFLNDYEFEPVINALNTYPATISSNIAKSEKLFSAYTRPTLLASRRTVAWRPKHLVISYEDFSLHEYITKFARKRPIEHFYPMFSVVLTIKEECIQIAVYDESKKEYEIIFSEMATPLNMNKLIRVIKQQYLVMQKKYDEILIQNNKRSIYP